MLSCRKERELFKHILNCARAYMAYRETGSMHLWGIKVSYNSIVKALLTTVISWSIWWPLSVNIAPFRYHTWDKTKQPRGSLLTSEEYACSLSFSFQILQQNKRQVIHSVIPVSKYFVYMCIHSAGSICSCCFRSIHGKWVPVPQLSTVLVMNYNSTQVLGLKCPRGRRKSYEFTMRWITLGRAVGGKLSFLLSWCSDTQWWL